MPNTLVLTSRFKDGKYEVLAQVKEGSDISPEIFIYEKTDDGSLGDYVGITALKELAKIPLYNPDKKSNFGSRYCRFTEGLAKLDTAQEQLNAANHMKATFKLLIDAFVAGSSDEVEEYAL